MNSLLDNFLHTVEDHDKSAQEQKLKVKAFAENLPDAFERLMDDDRFSCWLCPPAGDFSPHKRDYHDSAFSYYTAALLLLEPIEFGVALAFPFRDKPEEKWVVRLIVSAECVGNQLEINLISGMDLSRPDMLTDLPDPPAAFAVERVPIDFGGADVEEVATKFFDAIMEGFALAVRRYKEGSGQKLRIGFELATAKSGRAEMLGAGFAGSPPAGPV